MRFFVRTTRLHVMGFTLVELLISVAIVGILQVIASHFYFKYQETSKVAIAVNDIKIIEGKIKLFYLDTGSYPTTLAQVNAEMIDPWGNPYYYLDVSADDKVKGARKDKSLHPVNTDFDLYSAGEDGQTNAPLTAKSSRDDVLRGGNGSYYGLAEGF